MITPEDVPVLVLAACPSFAEVWAEIEVENADADSHGGRLLYLDAADLVRHLGALELAGDRSEFDAVFDLFERLHVERDDYVRELATIGYLESFHMLTIGSLGIDPERAFRSWLRPVSARWWDRLVRFWNGDHTALRE